MKNAIRIKWVTTLAVLMMLTLGITVLPVASAAKLNVHPAQVEQKIAAIGQVTPENYKEKRILIDEAKPLVNAYLSKVGDIRIANTVKNYYVYIDACARTEFYESCEALGVLAELIAPDEMPTAGEEIVLTLQLYNVGATDLINYSYRVTVAGLGATLSSDEETPFHLQVGQNKSFSIHLNALEGGQHPVTVALYNDLGEEVGVSVTEAVVVGGRGFYAGDSHTHSNGSDGRYTIADNAYSSYHKGALVLYATDHNANPELLVDLNRARLVMETAGYGDMVILKGNEITSMVKGAGHLLHYGSSTAYPAPSDKDNEKNKQLFTEIMDDIIAEGGTCYLAHPYDLTWPFYGVNESTKNIDIFTNFTGVEIFNGAQRGLSFANSQKAIEFWDRMNIKGDRKYFAIGNSDAHKTVDMNASQNVFLIPELSGQAYNNALGAGSFYVTCGPDLRFTINDTDMGGSIVMGKEGGKGTVNIVAYDALSPLTQVRLIKYTISEDNDAAYDGREVTVLFKDPLGNTGTYRLEQTLELDLKAGEFYRLEVSSVAYEGTNRMACSNPIWVTTAATELLMDSVVSAEAGGAIKLNITTDNVYDSLSLSTSDPEDICVYDNGRVEVAKGAQGIYTLMVENTSRTQSKMVKLYVGLDIPDEEKIKNEIYTVCIDLAGGSADYALICKVNHGDKLPALGDPVREGYRFLGFYQDAQGKTPFDCSAAIVKDTTLYARWEEDNSRQKTIIGVTLGIGAVALTAIVVTGIVLTRPKKKDD